MFRKLKKWLRNLVLKFKLIFGLIESPTLTHFSIKQLPSGLPEWKYFEDVLNSSLIATTSCFENENYVEYIHKMESDIVHRLEYTPDAVRAGLRCPCKNTQHYAPTVSASYLMASQPSRFRFVLVGDPDEEGVCPHIPQLLKI
jgi:hypothetical protein